MNEMKRVPSLAWSGAPTFGYSPAPLAYGIRKRAASRRMGASVLSAHLFLQILALKSAFLSAAMASGR